MFEPKVVSVIVHYDLRGNGKENNPYRKIKEYCDFDGNILAEETDEFLAAQKSAELAATEMRTGAAVAQPTEQSDAIALSEVEKVLKEVLYFDSVDIPIIMLKLNGIAQKRT